MDDIPTQISNNSIIPQDIRDDYLEWIKTGDDKDLTRLISHILSALEIQNYERVIEAKGDAAEFSADLGIDSLTLAEILFYTEDLLSVRIPNEEAAKLRSVGDFKAFLSKHRTECTSK